MNIDEFKGMVKGSIAYQRVAGPSMSALKVDDHQFICPFCYRPLEAKQVGNAYHYICSCYDSQIFNENLNEKIIELEKIQDKINELFKIIDKKGLDYFKSYYKNAIVPQMAEEIEKETKAILDIETID